MRLALHQRPQRVRQAGQLPGAAEVDPRVGAAARAGEGEAEAREGTRAEVFVVGAQVDGAGWGEGGGACVGEEGGEGGVCWGGGGGRGKAGEGAEAGVGEGGEAGARDHGWEAFV